MQVRVINRTDENQILKRGMEIATLFTEVEVDSETVDFEKRSKRTSPLTGLETPLWRNLVWKREVLNALHSIREQEIRI